MLVGDLESPFKRKKKHAEIDLIVVLKDEGNASNISNCRSNWHKREVREA